MCGLSERPWLVVAGVGNRFRTDDGVGTALVEAWQGRKPTPGVAAELWEELDGAGVAQRLIELDRPVLIVDCAELGAAGGHCRLLGGEELLRVVPRNVVSTHGFGLAEALPLARALGFARPLWLLAVQPFATAVGGALSSPMLRALPALGEALADAVATIQGELGH